VKPEAPAKVEAQASTAAPPSSIAASVAAPTEPPPTLDGTMLDAVETLADVPPETRLRLVTIARVHDLGADDEVTSFAVAFVMSGEAHLCATIVDERVSRATAGTLVPTRGTFGEAVALRLVAGTTGARVAVWEQPAIDDALRTCPWVREELAGLADRLQALAGATMGPLGELDEATRGDVLDRLGVLVARPDDAIPSEVAAAALVCVGSVDVGEGDAAHVVRSGDVLFPRADALPAKAGAQGAILLVGNDAVLAGLVSGPLPVAQLFAPRP
jgi:hypothetical protein